MNEHARAQIRLICRQFGLGPIEFEPDGSVTLHSKIPILDRIKVAFPLAEIIDYGQFSIDEHQAPYWTRIYPEPIDLIAEVIELPLHK